MTDHESPAIREMLHACPFLRGYLDLRDGPYVIMGSVGTLIQDRALSEDEMDCVFSFWNELAERADIPTQTLLAEGVLEMLNDDAATARLARRKLRGKALELTEQMRQYWGQPDYSD